MNTKKRHLESADRSDPPIQPAARGFLLFLYLTTVVAGAEVMLIEVLGARLIGPFFGINLFVWTSVIAVTLVSLTVGYAVGGQLADRRPTPDLLYVILAAAGLMTLLIPWIRPPVMKQCVGLGLRAGCLAASLILLAPPLCLLGCMTPYVIRIATRRLGRLGRTVGGLTALSTMGSVAGTVLTGFLLIPTFGVSAIIRFAGALQLLLALIYFLLFARRKGALLFLPLALLAFHDKTVTTKLQPNGTKFTVLDRIDSSYGTIKVVDYTYQSRHTRELLVDGMVQGGLDLVTGASVYEYAYFLSYLPVRMKPTGKSCLAIGVGAGIVPAWYAERGIAVDAIEIDPAILATARKHFGFKVNGRVLTGDARVMMGKLPNRYDYLLLDVFGGEAPPPQMLTRESFAEVRAKLAPGGILAMNMIGSLDARRSLVPSVIRTLKELFPNVHVFPTYAVEPQEWFGNIEILAYDGRRRGIPHRIDFPVSPIVAPRLARSFGKEQTAIDLSAAFVLTDDYNPAERLDLPLRFALRRGLLAGTDWDLLL